MVEMKFVGCSALYAFTAIALPDLELDACWNYAAMFCFNCGRNIKVFFADYSNQLELENFAAIRLFTPGINKMEYTVVRPDSLSDFLIHAHPLRWPQT